MYGRLNGGSTFQNTLLDQLFRIGPALQTLLETVGAHMTLEFALVALQCGSRDGVGKDVAYGLPPSELACVLYGGAGGLLGMNSAVSRE